MDEGGETRLQRLHVGLILKNHPRLTNNNTSVDECERQKLRETIHKYSLVIFICSHKHLVQDLYLEEAPLIEHSVTFFSLQTCCLTICLHFAKSLSFSNSTIQTSRNTFLENCKVPLLTLNKANAFYLERNFFLLLLIPYNFLL